MDFTAYVLQQPLFFKFSVTLKNDNYSLRVNALNPLNQEPLVYKKSNIFKSLLDFENP